MPFAAASPTPLPGESGPRHAGSPWPTGNPFKPHGRFLPWLKQYQDDIISEWVDRLGQLSPAYRRRPTSEFFVTATGAFLANLRALEHGDPARIDQFIDFITKKRLEAGFPLSDVQKAFELFREIVVERLSTPEFTDLLAESVPQINACLAYTIHRFSDYFQKMHERSLRRHAANLERKVRTRTAELAESEKRYKTLVNEINDGYFVVQGERVVFANRAFCAMHGASESGVVGRPFFHFVSPEDRHRVMGALWEALAKRSPEGQTEYSRSGRPPEEAVTEMRYKVVDLGQGPVTIGICRDISQRVALEATIREHERMAYVGHVAASLSHEIRNPLSTCTLNMMILNEKLELSGFDRRRLEITVRELTRLEDILKQLLDLARPLHLDVEAVELKAVAEDCADLLAGKTAEKRIDLRQRHSPRLGPVVADAAKLEQALLNLLLNAIESVDAGGRITVWTRRTADSQGVWAELGVHDNGPGIAPEVRAGLFAPFATNKAQGTGLGLSNVKRIVEAHDGRVLVKSRPGLGATFSLRLPCRP